MLLEAREAFAKARKSVDLGSVMTASPVTPELLASALAARLIHDIIGPASGIVSAFDLAADPRAAAMHREALAMAASTARELVATLTLVRTIYGGGGAAMSRTELTAAAEAIFAGSRATLTPRIGHPPTATSSRVFLGLTQIMATAAAAGGMVSAAHDISGDTILMTFDGVGPRVRLHPEIPVGLAGESPGGGEPHRWSAAYLLGAVARAAGGTVQANVADGGVSLRAVIRADMA